MPEQKSERLLVYIGTYTRGRSEGIYVYRMDPGSGALESVSAASGASGPSFLALHPNGRSLYAVSESDGSEEESDGAVCAFSVAPGSGELTLLNRQPSHGSSPCHVDVDQTGRYAFVANYGSGSVAMLPIQPDGSLGPACDFVQHHGSSVDLRRQKGPHAHSINVDPTNRYALVPDLGLDRVMVYRLDLVAGKLIPAEEPYVQIIPGSGPRHLAFHPNSRYVYVINEMGNTITGFTYDGERGVLGGIQMRTTLPWGWEGTSYCADIHLSPSGAFLYGTNRGHDSIAVFAVHPGMGLLDLVAHTPTQGNFPRNFGLDPSGRFLLAANQNSDTVVTFRVDQRTGLLTPTGQVTQVPAPVCVRFLSVAGS